MYSLYLVTNLINKKRYAGITSQSIRDRFTQHCTQGGSLTNAIRKYGRNNFKIELVASSKGLLTIKSYEIRYIKGLRLTDRCLGYNISEGGDLAPKSETTRKKISAKLKGKPKSESHRRKIKKNAEARGARLRGKKRPPFSSVWKANISKGSKGKILSQSHREAVSRGIRLYTNMVRIYGVEVGRLERNNGR